MFASDAFFFMLIVITCPFTVTHVFEVYFSVYVCYAK